jgi:hypothetical protein
MREPVPADVWLPAHLAVTEIPGGLLESMPVVMLVRLIKSVNAKLD